MNDSPIAVLADATSGALVTTIQDGTARRLQVDARNTRPNGASVINRYMLNGSSSSMMVSGTAGAPIRFIYSPASGTTATVTGISLVVTAATINFAGSTKFLNGGALPNGLLAGVTVGGVANTLALLKCNEEFLLFSGGGNVSTGTAAGLFTAGTNSILTFSLGFSQQLTSSDSVYFLVQDNITSANTGNNLVYMSSAVEGFLN